MTGGTLDYVEFEDDYAMVTTRAPRRSLGQPLSESALRGRYGVTIVAVKRAGQDVTDATDGTVIHRDDMVVVAGRVHLVEQFAELS